MYLLHKKSVSLLFGIYVYVTGFKHEVQVYRHTQDTLIAIICRHIKKQIHDKMTQPPPS